MQYLWSQQTNKNNNNDISLGSDNWFDTND